MSSRSAHPSRPFPRERRRAGTAVRPREVAKTALVSDFRRTQILNAARQSVVRHGVADTTVSGIARAAGVAKGTVYLYYRSKDDILRQLVGQNLTEFHADTVPIVSEPGSLDEKLRRFLQAELGFFDRKRDFVERCHFEMSPEVRRKMRQKLGAVFAAQADAWRTALEDPGSPATVRGDEAAGAAHTIVSLAYGLAIQRLRGWSSESIDSTVDGAARLLQKGWTTR